MSLLSEALVQYAVATVRLTKSQNNMDGAVGSKIIIKTF